jgi:3-oxoacyl-[acyl-carrier-protein] synthase II
MSREVVITGAGIVSPAGKDVHENWKAVKHCKTGLARHDDEDRPESFRYYGSAGEIEIPEDIPPRQQGQMKFLNRGAFLGFRAAYDAVYEHRSAISEIEPGRRALYVAAGDFTKVGYDFMYPAIRDSVDGSWEKLNQAKLNDSALNKVNPFFLLESLNNNLFSFLSAVIEFMGPNTSLASLSPCGGNAVELAYRSIRQNKADVALAVGYGNWITRVIMYELEGLGILSRCKDGESSFRPFDRRRDGFIPGEGGAALLLENKESAIKRGADIYGIISGVENCTEFASDSNMSVPSEVAARNMKSVLKSAGISIQDLSFIVAHGSGTARGDRSEMHSLINIMKGSDMPVPVCGLKPYTGHMGAASDIAEIIFGLFAVREGMIPATLNFEATEKEFSSLNISGSTMKGERDFFLSFSYGVGGQSSSIVVKGT